MNAEDPVPEEFEFFGDPDANVAFERAWFGLMRVHRKVMPEVTKALKAHGVNDPVWFEILLELARSGDDGHPMALLEEKLSVPQYALSRHIGRMESEGLLRRDFIADGRRKQILFLTEKGVGAHQRIWPIYSAAMQAELSPFLSAKEAYMLTWLLMKVTP